MGSSWGLRRTGELANWTLNPECGAAASSWQVPPVVPRMPGIPSPGDRYLVAKDVLDPRDNVNNQARLADKPKRTFPHRWQTGHAVVIVVIHTQER